MADERLLFRTRPHPIVLVGWALLILVLQTALLAGSPILPRILASFMPAWWLGVLLLEYFGTVYEATAEALTKRQGILWHHGARVPLGAIQNLTFSAGVLGLLVGYGKLEIESAGTKGRIVLHALPTQAYRLLRPLRRHRQRR